MKKLITSVIFIGSITFLITFGITSTSDNVYSVNSLSVSSQTSQFNKKLNADEILKPCCNNLDPRTNSGPIWGIDCSGSSMDIDSICCVNIWEYFSGPPPSPLQCYIVYERCPI